MPATEVADRGEVLVEGLGRTRTAAPRADVGNGSLP